MKTLLICHEDEPLNHLALSRWLASFSELSGVVVLNEGGGRMRQRVKREVKRVGYLRFLDVLAFRLYYRLFLAAGDRAWEEAKLTELLDRYPPVPDSTPVITSKSPNTKSVKAFVEEAQPDIIIARCKTLLRERIFTLAKDGTFVMHPGICPEYRNAHGCFWALAEDDLDKVGMTLLKIDKGVDTGPVYGYYSYPYDEVSESHIVIQNRVVLDNLDELASKLEEIHAGRAETLPTAGRESATWGQPWLSAYLRWKAKARKRSM